jgi:hypothetical protein
MKNKYIVVLFYEDEGSRSLATYVVESTSKDNAFGLAMAKQFNNNAPLVMHQVTELKGNYPKTKEENEKKYLTDKYRYIDGYIKWHYESGGFVWVKTHGFILGKNSMRFNTKLEDVKTEPSKISFDYGGRDIITAVVREIHRSPCYDDGYIKVEIVYEETNVK